MSKDKKTTLFNNLKVTIMNTEFFVKLQNPIMRTDATTLDELRVSIDQCKGGYNYAYGFYEDSGIKVFFTPIHREGNTYTTTFLSSLKESGFKVQVANTKRKSQKKIDKVADAIKPLLEDFGKIWGQPDFDHTIATMVMNATEDVRK